MKPFNLQEALAGKPVVTREGTKVLGIAQIPFSKNNYKLVVQLEKCAVPTFATESGRFSTDPIREHEYDLFMASEKKTGWIVVCELRDGSHYSGRVHNTRLEAETRVRRQIRPAQVVQIEWEE